MPPSPSPSLPASPEWTTLLSERSTWLSYLRRKMNLTDAEDLLQQAFLRASQKWGGLRDVSKWKPWFYQILRRLIADHLAAQQRWTRAIEAAYEPTEETASVEAPDADPKVCCCSLGLLSELRPEYADVLRAVDIDELSSAEVATRLGTTANNVMVRLHRARKALKTKLQETCQTTNVRACNDCACDR